MTEPNNTNTYKKRSADMTEMEFKASLSLQRLMPVVEFAMSKADIRCKGRQWDDFIDRLEKNWPAMFELLFGLYQHRYDFFYHLESIVITMARGAMERNAELVELDHHRINDPEWFKSNKMVGGALYVDLFSENLSKLRDQIPYFKELGLSYIHLMPLFAVRPGDNDGGYAVSNYRSVNPELGTIEDLVKLADDLRHEGICLVLDFIFNHTADDHAWAKAAQSGDREFQEFYHIYPDRNVPDQYEHHLREIFPTVRRGNFTWHPGMRQWVWTTFNSFQWDLRYENPAVFRAMLDEMIFLANTGVDILRLDAVAFIWKQMGTNCENLPQAHNLIQAFNVAARIAIPGLLFKSEAIVHPDEVLRYVSPRECQLSYNPLLMALLWESLATRKISLLYNSIKHRHVLPEGCSWANYLRCHDDIGWTFDNQDAWDIGINPDAHRRFLNDFYTGQFEGSFARGVPFQYNEDTGDMRISGTMASLAGLEQAIDEDNQEYLELAVKRIMLLHSVVMSIGGIPLLYLGEEWGQLNNYDYIRDPDKADDSRWIHRPKIEWEYIRKLQDGNTVQKEIFEGIRSIISIRKDHIAMGGVDMEAFNVENEHVFAYIRKNHGARVICMANFSEQTQVINGNLVRTHGYGRFFTDLISGEEISASKPIHFDSYQYRWLEMD